MGSTYTHRLVAHCTVVERQLPSDGAVLTQTHGLNSFVNLEKLWTLEADLATGHRVAELGLVVDEGHDAQIGLDEQGSLQDQDAVGSTGDGVLLVGFLYCLHQLGPEVIHLGK